MKMLFAIRITANFRSFESRLRFCRQFHHLRQTFSKTCFCRVVLDKNLRFTPEKPFDRGPVSSFLLNWPEICSKLCHNQILLLAYDIPVSSLCSYCAILLISVSVADVTLSQGDYDLCLWSVHIPVPRAETGRFRRSKENIKLALWKWKLPQVLLTRANFYKFYPGDTRFWHRDILQSIVDDFEW
jgi:hypothetical protein